MTGGADAGRLLDRLATFSAPNPLSGARAYPKATPIILIVDTEMTMIRTVAFAAILMSLATPLLAHSAPAPGAGDKQLSSDDKAFLKYAAEDNQAEIDLCILAEKEARSPAVKAFARLMVDDHVEIESHLAAVSESEKADLPDGLGQEGQKTRAKLEPLTGSAFEKAFMDAQIEDHGNDLKKFARENSSTQNAALRQYSAETRPILEQHLDLARAVQASLKSE